MKLDAIETKLTAARAKLILDKPFLGALVLRLPLAAADPNWCATTATDARKFYYNPQFIDSPSMAQTQFMLAHEALHCALSHFARRQHRVQHRWDLACDYAINPLLLEDGLTPPPNCHVMPEYLGMTAEEIYPLIDENDETETIDQHLFDQDNQSGGGQQGNAPDKPENDQTEPGKGGARSQREDDSDQGGETPLDQRSEDRNGQGGRPMQAESLQSDAQQDDGQTDGRGEPTPPPLSNDERQTLEVQWQQRLAGAAQQAMQAGKMGGSMARLVDHLLQPQLPWRMMLARYMTAMARDDFTYMRPSRREGDAILPSLKSSQVEIAVSRGRERRDQPAGLRAADVHAPGGQPAGALGRRWDSAPAGLLRFPGSPAPAGPRPRPGRSAAPRSARATSSTARWRAPPRPWSPPPPTALRCSDRRPAAWRFPWRTPARRIRVRARCS